MASNVTEEINLMLDEGQASASVAVGASLPDAVQQVATSPQPVMVLSGFEALPEEDWASLNFSRSRLLGDHALVFVMGKDALRRLQERAPDLDSLLSGSTWQLDTQADILSADEREQRLEALRRGLDLTDAEVLAQAESGELPSDPRLAEWLVLLGRGDLLVQ
ncbi:hypothetical protein BVG81_003445 [Haliangium sp. UPWRP_2]|nr:hypothetical protein BVG81_003445 [Haliangium sp. UPWRP_2]